MSLLSLLAGILAMWVFVLVIGVVMWVLVNYLAESAEGYVADGWERRELRGRR